MDIIFINSILVIFPVLVYLVLSCFDLLINSKINKLLFLITNLTSLYLSLNYSLNIQNNLLLLMFCNIPIIISYLKKKCELGLIFSGIVILTTYINNNTFLVIMMIKYLLYLITYIVLSKNKKFNYLFLKIVALIQSITLSFEYFSKTPANFNQLFELYILAVNIYIIIFMSLYLFKLADNISNMHQMINKNKRDIELKNSLFKLTHEVKNPLAVCKGYLDMIDINDQEKTIKYIEIIKSEINRSLNIMNDFMEYSKIKINKEEFDMSLLLESIYTSFKLLTKGKNIKLEYLNKYEEIYINGDYNRLEQVFVNIIKNSIESIDKNGIIKLTVKKLTDKLEIIIIDNGCGMAENVLNNLKEMFYTTKKDGTGLGVSLSNEIILAHNGSITYESTKDKGTTCKIMLPLSN